MEIHHLRLLVRNALWNLNSFLLKRNWYTNLISRWSLSSWGSPSCRRSIHLFLLSDSALAAAVAALAFAIWLDLYLYCRWAQPSVLSRPSLMQMPWCFRCTFGMCSMTAALTQPERGELDRRIGYCDVVATMTICKYWKTDFWPLTWPRTHKPKHPAAAKNHFYHRSR